MTDLAPGPSAPSAEGLPERPGVIHARPVRHPGRWVALAAIAGEIVLAGVAFALAWRMRLTPSEFERLLPTILANARVMIAAQAIVLAAKIQALNRGQAFVSVHDVRAVALPALRHRILLNFEGEADEVGTDAIVDELLATGAARRLND